MPRPLEGVLVADFTTLLPGPLATLMLAEAGARVVKIERPGGEDVRRFPPFKDGHSVSFAILNRGKESLVADLKNEQSRSLGAGRARGRAGRAVPPRGDGATGLRL